MNATTHSHNNSCRHYAPPQMSGIALSLHVTNLVPGPKAHTNHNAPPKLSQHCVIPLCRVGQHRISALYMTVYMVISLPKIPYIHRIYL